MARRHGGRQGGRQGGKPGGRPGEERRDRQGNSAPAPARRAETKAAPRARGERLSGLVLYGIHPVVEALKNPRRRFGRLFLTENARARIVAAVPVLPVEPTLVRPEFIDDLLDADAVHQGVALEVESLPGLSIHDLPEEGIVVVLDQVTDPHNVGAILRSAAAFGAAGVILTDRHSPQATGVLAKAASGALEHVPLISVGNLAQALAELGDRGFWRIGLDSDGSALLEQAVATPPIAIVLGAEGKGLRRLTRERCDALARLDMPGPIRSLNVSNAAAVALYALARILETAPR